MPSVRAELPMFGVAADRREAVIAIGGSVALTILYAQIASHLDTPTSRLEFWSLAFSFACVWLSRTENIFSMHTGIASSILMGIFLLRVDIVAQGWIQFAYYVPIQLYGWWVWCRGGSGRTELPVSRLNKREWIVWVLGFAVVWIATYVLFDAVYVSPRYLMWDTSIVAGSIVAQILMMIKKVDCWIFWLIPVNVSSIVFYGFTNVPAFVVMYVIFLLNAVFGLQNWVALHQADSR